jgi:hypothetical protein
MYAGVGGSSVVTSGGGGGGSTTAYRNSIDAPPVSPNAANDEFTGTSLGGAWSTAYTTGVSGVVKDSKYVVRASTATTNRLNGAFKAFTWNDASAYYAAFQRSSPLGNYHGAAMMVRNSVNNRLSGLLWIGHSGYGHGALIGSSFSDFDTIVAEANYGVLVPSDRLYMRLHKSGTSLHMAASMDGTDFSQVGSIDLSAYVGTPDQIFVGSHVYSTGINNSLGVDWYRVGAASNSHGEDIRG